MGRVVISTQFLAETLPDEGESSQRRDKGDLERVPEQVSEIRLCVRMHWHGVHLTPGPGQRFPQALLYGRGTCVPTSLICPHR